MRLRKPIEPAGWLLRCGAFALLPAQAAAPADAPPRHRLCESCAMPALPIALPRKGLIFHYDPVMSSVSPWYVVDFERGEASRILAQRHVDRGLPGLAIVEQVTRAITGHGLARLRQIGSEIRALEDRLLDGDDARHELAAGVPTGPSKEILLMIQRVLERPAPSE